MGYNKNSIDTSTFSFSYESKILASRCNNLIESILNTSIFPELEVAISNKIPEGAEVEIQLLEIDIGTINEKELMNTLAHRIRLSMEEALHHKINVKQATSLRIGSLPSSNPNSYLFAALELYLLRGYFPSWMGKNASLDNLIKNIIKEASNELIQVLRKHRSNETVMKRLSFETDPRVFEDLLFAVNSAHFDWIIKFRNSILTIEEGDEFSKFGNKKSLQIMHLFIISYLFNEPAKSFNKRRFIESILPSYLSMFKVHPKVFEKTLSSDYIEFKDAVLLISCLQEIKKEEKSISSDLSIQKFIKRMNSKKFYLCASKESFFKKKVLKVIRNNRSRVLLKEELNDMGILHILEIFFKKNKNHLVDFIKAFIYSFKKNSGRDEVITLSLTLTSLSLIAIEYLDKKSADNFNYEGYFLGLISLLGFTKKSIDNNTRLKYFIEKQSRLNKVKFIKLISNKSSSKKQIETITKANYFDLVTHNGRGVKPDNKVIISVKSMNILKRKIIEFYLEFGFLAKDFVDLTILDIQNLFLDLIISRDPFLATKIRSSKNTSFLFKRIELFISDEKWEFLDEYLGYYFKNTSRMIASLVDNFKKQLGHSPYPNFNIFYYKMLLKSIIGSKGELNRRLFVFCITKGFIESAPTFFMDSNLIIDYSVSENIYSRSNEIENIEAVTIPNFHLLIEIEIRRDYLELINLLSRQKGGELLVNKLNIMTDKFKYYVKVYPNQLLAVIAEDIANISHMLIFLKLYLPTEIWKLFKEFAVKIPEFKKAIVIFQKESEGLFNEIRTLEFDILAEIKKNGAIRIFNESPTNSKDIKSKIRYDLSILVFYSNFGFSPWWSDKKNFSELIDSIGKKSKLFGKSFESVFLEIEKEGNFIKKLQNTIPKFFIEALSSIFISHRLLNRKWQKYLFNVPLEGEVQNIKSTDFIVEGCSKLKLNIDIFIDIDYQDPNFLNRSLYQFNDKELLKVWIKDKSGYKNEIEQLLKLSPYFYFKNLNPFKWRQLVYTFVFNFYKTQQSPSLEIFHKSFRNFLKKKYSATDWIAAFSFVKIQVASLSKKKRVVFPTVLHSYVLDATNNEVKAKRSSKLDKVDDFEVQDGIEINIANAGLVLVWPFLTRYFEQLSLLKGGEFRNSESRNRAIYLLQYLVFNQTDYPEFEMVLNKFMVGMPLKEHLSPLISFTKEEKDLSRSLINGLINNWGKVKNSSIEAIQETFLQRKGLMIIHKEKVTLKINKTGVDILLESISWNISLIKLPWMQKPIYVEWI
jgi:hypothetical protein